MAVGRFPLPGKNGAAGAFPYFGRSGETHPVHKDDTTYEWGASPLNEGKGGK